MMRTKAWWVLLDATFWGALAIGCGSSQGGGGPVGSATPGPDVLPGGQSGTDGSDSGSCKPVTTPFALDEHIDILSLSANDLFELVGGTRELPGLWVATGEPVTLGVDIQELDSVSIATNCGPADFGIVAHVTSSDDSIDTTTTNLHLGVQEPAKLEIPLPDLSRALLPAAGAGAQPTLTISINLANDGNSEDAEAVLSAGTILGRWSSHPWTLPKPVPSLYAAPQFMSSACASAPEYSGDYPFDYTPLDSAADARSMAIGTWVYCSQPTVTGSVGFRIAADGSTRDIVSDGDGLALRGGFGHETQLTVFDTGAMNESPGLYQIGASDFTGYFWQGMLAYSDDHGVKLLLPSSATIPEAVNPFQSMARAGSAACGTAEADIATFDSGDELAQLLAGSWVRCSGSLPNGGESLRFDPDTSTLTFKDANGTTLDESVCDLSLNSPGSTHQLVCLGFKSTGTWASWRLDFSKRPLMLEITNGTRSAIFSAEP